MSTGSATGFHHRSSLKQKNKPFKGTTKAKAAVSRGKIDHKTLVGSNVAGPNLNKADRKNQSKLKQLARKSALSDLRKIFSGPDGVARTVALIPLTPSGNVMSVLEGLFKGAGKDFDPQTCCTEPLYIESFKQNIRFFCPDRNNLLQVIDTVAAVDTLLFVVSAKDESIDLLGVDLLEVLRAQGMCTAVACIQDLEASGIKSAKQHDLRTNWLNSLSYHLASTLHPRLFSLDHFETRRESIEMLRIICQLSIYEGISWRDVHPYLVAEKTEVSSENTFKITGRVRGSRNFSVNQLVHIPGIGDFQLAKLTAFPTRRNRNSSTEMDTNEPLTIIPDPQLQEQLFALSSEDLQGLENEDKEKEMMSLKIGEEREKCIVRVPKGTSAYQARVIHEAGLDYPLSSDSEEDFEDSKSIASAREYDDDEEELTDVDINEQEESKKDKERDEREMEEAIQDYAALKRKQLDEAEPLSKVFPDAVEVPEDQPARIRFSKYRGVESLRTSEWDASADVLPKYMENIFEFDTFKLSMKRALAVDEEEVNKSPFGPGKLVQLELSLNSSIDTQSLLAKLSNPLVPLCVFGLLAHEQKYSILNLNLQPRSTSVNIRSKEPVLMIYGFRRLEVSPIYSDASHGHNLHTMHRIMPSDRPCTASVLAPIAYPPTSVLFFRPKSDCTVSLLASGSLETIKPSRVILKRISFIGYPFKIHRRTCTVRFMFFNPTDVNWFRPIELITSRQFRRGHIKESLGTHGYMKCIFDKQIQQNEQIAMHLYKRTYPKWLTRNCTVAALQIDNDRPEENSMEI